MAGPRFTALLSLVILLCSGCTALHSGFGRSELRMPSGAAGRCNLPARVFSCGGSLCRFRLRGGAAEGAAADVANETEAAAGQAATGEGDDVAEDQEAAISGEESGSLADPSMQNKTVYEAAFGIRTSTPLGAAAHNLAISAAMAAFVTFARTRTLLRASDANPAIMQFMTYAVYAGFIMQVLCGCLWCERLSRVRRITILLITGASLE